MKKILIANRGEIAVRILRTCRDMGIATVAVYSDCDRTAMHTRLADEAYAIGPDRASESYLRIDKLIDVARKSHADAIHPGYGFLAENPDFADACARANIIFIGPTPHSMRLMGDKVSAREVARQAGVPLVPGMDAAVPREASDADLAAAADLVGYPLLVKAAAGGGGKGMRVVPAAVELIASVRLARSEAASAFGDDTVYFERLISRPRHIEVQLLGDQHGAIAPFVERECSIQRRHQKLIEETPSPTVDPTLRSQLTGAAAAIGRAAGYSGAGTIEFLLDADRKFFFLEMNTRLQVEHPVTEAVTGVDFVRAQIEVARGVRLGRVLGDNPERLLNPVGHAIECRVYAEDPSQGFLPSPGLITHLRAPAGPGVRDDSGAAAGWRVPTAYDPLISKVIAWAPDRTGAIARMVRALQEYDLRGVSTTISFCREVLESSDFRSGHFDTGLVDRLVGVRHPLDSSGNQAEIAAIAAAIALYANRTRPETDPEADSLRMPESLWARRARLDALR